MHNRLAKWIERAAPYWPILIVVLFAAFFFPLLGARPFHTEEGRRVAQALAILDGGSWWRLEVFGEPYLSKPPLIPWAIAISGSLLGSAGEFAARIPGVIIAFLTTIAVATMAWKVSATRLSLAALAAGVYYLATRTVFIRVRTAETDNFATAFGAFAFLIWAVSRLNGRIGTSAWMLIAVCFAGALLAKGPIQLLFPLTAMLGVPLIERKWRELGAMVLALWLGFMPLVAWIVINLDHASVHMFAGQMRLAQAGKAWTFLLSAQQFGAITSAVLQTVPAIIVGLVWIVATKSWRVRSSQWPSTALFLYAVPMLVIVALWPGSSSHHVMPAAWPFAVMGGLATAHYWPSRASVWGLVASLWTLIVIQSVFLIRAGQTESQIAARAEADELRAAFAELPAGRTLLLAVGDNPTNRFVYAGRDLHRISADEITCPPVADYLLAEGDFRRHVEATAGWAALRELKGDILTIYARTDDAHALIACAATT